MYSVIQAAISAGILVIILVGFLILAFGFFLLPSMTYLVGEKYGHKDAGFIIGLLFDIWIVALISFIIANQNL